MRNKYSFRARISEAKVRQIVRLFALAFNASQTAQILRRNRNTLNRHFAAFRERIARSCEAQSPVKGESEGDKSYFGPHRGKGVRGRGARAQNHCLGPVQTNGRPYTEIVPDCLKATLQGIFRGRVALESVIHSAGWRGYEGLVDLRYQKHFRVESNHEFANKHSHIKGRESFWAFAKTRVSRFRGVQNPVFYLHLKACEFRFNHRREDIAKIILTLLKNDPLG